MDDLETLQQLMLFGESAQDCVRRIRIERQAMHEAISQLIKEKELAYTAAEKNRNELEDAREALELATAMSNFIRRHSGK